MRRTARYLMNLTFALSLSVAQMDAATAAQEAKPLTLWGYGVKRCEEFLQAAAREDEGVAPGISEYRRYEDWLTGFISGLALATGTDVLRGADIETALRRIHAYCGGHRRDDFFTATMDLIRMLSSLP